MSSCWEKEEGKCVSSGIPFPISQNNYEYICNKENSLNLRKHHIYNFFGVLLPLNLFSEITLSRRQGQKYECGIRGDLHLVQLASTRYFLPHVAR